MRLQNAFPRSLDKCVNRVLMIIPAAGLGPVGEIGPVSIGSEQLHIPFRIYCDQPPALLLRDLNDLDRLVLSCLFTRHHDGRIREKYLRGILHSEEPWIPPYVLQLLGEYVVEIAQVVLLSPASTPKDSYSLFQRENPDFMDITRQRIISYWNCYYRGRFPFFHEYPAFQAMEALGLWKDRDNKRLLSRGYRQQELLSRKTDAN